MGVKSLWNIVTPVGRPVALETLEGQALAIDSSIWIYQFQATMRDKDGRALVNAHLLGFFRRICKLLFYGIKPVFVFDGGAPVLKRMTITERKKKKSGAAITHAKLAEKLLAAQLRREALNAHQSQTSKNAKGKGKVPSGPVVIDDDTVYLEDIDNSTPKTPSRKQGKGKNPNSPPTSGKNHRFHDHDPYRLPDVNLEEAVAKATSPSAPDPRLATEDELRAFIEEMRPEDFDVTSPAFRELPTEVQYEIVGDLRLKSRQTSYKRLQNMLKNAATPLDFSRQQIQNLKQRNTLTQQLLITTDSIGSAHLSIPVRIASERNKEYMLVKNEGEGGGWILGIRDDGTQAKPITIDHDNSDRDGASDESDIEMEKVDIPSVAVADPDLRDYRREMALSAIAGRYSPKKLAPLTTKPIQRKENSIPLFYPDDEEVGAGHIDDSDEELAFAIQASLDQSSSTLAFDSSQITSLDASGPEEIPKKTIKTPSPMMTSATDKWAPEDEDNFPGSTRLQTVLSIANAAPSPRRPILRTHAFQPPVPSTPTVSSSTLVVPSDSEDDMEKIIPGQTTPITVSPVYRPTSSPDLTPQRQTLHSTSLLSSGESSDDDMEEVLPTFETSRIERQVLSELPLGSPDSVTPRESQLNDEMSLDPQPVTADDYLLDSDDDPSSSPVAGPSNSFGLPEQLSIAVENWDAAQEMDPHGEEGEFARFISQVKGKDLDDVRREIDDEIKSLNQQRKAAMRDSEDVTQQMIAQIMMMLRLFGIPYITAPMEAEAQCAELVSLGLVHGIITDDSDVFLFGGLRVFKNMFNQAKTVECFFLSDLKREIGLDRDALVRLAYLLGSDYVDGLLGVGPVVAMELLKEFPGQDGLHKFRDWWFKVQSGKDKPEDNKSKFRKRFKKQFKKLYLEQEWPNPAVARNYLLNRTRSPHFFVFVKRDAYYHPTVDSSDEPFKWGLPDLDALRDFLGEELGWHQSKVDEVLLPIIQKMGKRGQAAAKNKQGNLNEFFDVATGSGTFAPRKRQVYASKRLQEVVSDFRSQQHKRKADSSTHDSGSGDEPEESPANKKVNTKSKISAGSSTRKRGKTRGRSTRKKEDSSSDYASDSANVIITPREQNVQLRPRPKPAYKGA